MQRIYFHDDLDGAACAVIARCAFPDKTKTVTIPVSYNILNAIHAEAITFLQENVENRVAFLDLPGPVEVLQPPNKCEIEIHKCSPSLIYPGSDSPVADGIPFGERVTYIARPEYLDRMLFIDHHKNNKISDEIKQIAPGAYEEGFYAYMNNIWSTKFCAAAIVYQSLSPRMFAADTEEASVIMEGFVYAVDAWDMWLLDSPLRDLGEMLNDMFQMFAERDTTHGIFIDWVVNKINVKRPVVPTVIEREALNKFRCHKWDTITNILYFSYPNDNGKEGAFKFTFNNVETQVMYRAYITDKYQSDIASVFDYEEFIVDVLAMYSPTKRTVSLHSARDGIDVSEIAKLYGGGGHKHAAGFSLSNPASEINPFVTQDGRLK